MKVIRGGADIRAGFKSSVVAIGFFDGVHRGHAKVIKRAVLEGRKENCPSVVVTFDEQAKRAACSPAESGLITGLDERAGIMAGLGLRVMLVLNFESRLRGMSPESFIEKVICAGLKARAVVVGTDFRFGRGRRGDVSLLEELSSHYGFSVIAVPPLTMDGVRISSRRIRAALMNGDLDTAVSLLGHGYAVTGTVKRQSGRGRELGFPTANLDTEAGLILPRGVYTARVRAQSRSYRGVVNIGLRPTFRDDGEQGVFVEVHIFNFSGNLYGREVRCELVRKIRKERKFRTPGLLVGQIQKDIREAKKHFKYHRSEGKE